MQAANWVQNPSTGSVVTRTLNTYRDNFLPIFVLSVIVQIPLSLLSLILTIPALQRIGDLIARVQIDPETGTLSAADAALLNTMVSDMVSAFASIALILVALALIQVVVLNGPLTYIAAESHFGNRAGLLQAFRGVSSRLPGYAIGVILVAVVLGAVSFGLSLVFFLCGLGFGVLAWLSLTLYTFLAPVYILERVNVFESLNRAWSLGKLYVWPILRVSLIVIVGTGAVNYVISSLVPVSEVTAQGGIGFTFNPIATFINIVVGALLAPIGAIAATIQYLDARAQYEGLDVSLARLGKHGARPADVESPPAGTFLTSKDMTNMFLMTLIVVGLFFLAFIVLGTVAPILNPRLN